jgi:hypothetical protein
MMTKVMSKIATNDAIRVVAGQEFSFMENMTGDMNGANPVRSTEPRMVIRSASRRGGRHGEVLARYSAG